MKEARLRIVYTVLHLYGGQEQENVASLIEVKLVYLDLERRT